MIASTAAASATATMPQPMTTRAKSRIALFQQSRPTVIPEGQVVLGDDALQALQRDGGRLLDCGQRLAVLVQPDGCCYFRGGYSGSTHGYTILPFNTNCNSIWQTLIRY